jgi:hypothetical protein
VCLTRTPGRVLSDARLTCKVTRYFWNAAPALGASGTRLRRGPAGGAGDGFRDLSYWGVSTNRPERQTTPGLPP